MKFKNPVSAACFRGCGKDRNEVAYGDGSAVPGASDGQKMIEGLVASAQQHLKAARVAEADGHRQAYHEQDARALERCARELESESGLRQGHDCSLCVGVSQT